MKKLEVLVQEFEDFTLPLEEWHHDAHIRIALWYIFHAKTSVPELEVLCKFRCGAIRYASHAKARSKETYNCAIRYSETITMFWIEKINAFIINNYSENLEEIEEKLLQSKLNSSKYILEFYSQELLDSVRAHAFYLKSDGVRVHP